MKWVLRVGSQLRIAGAVNRTPIESRSNATAREVYVFAGSAAIVTNRLRRQPAELR
jgi:hypothetical protein